MAYILSSFIAGILTVLSPCVLPLIPVIIGGSLSSKSKYRPYIITASLSISIITFTLLLKVSSVLINVSPDLLKLISALLIISFGLFFLFPQIWDKINIKLGLSNKSNKILNDSSKKEGILGSILIGASLGPVFSSCSPTYAIIIATVLPADFSGGLLDLIAYALGLSLLMLLIALFGQQLIKKLKFAVNPNGKFRKVLGILFIVVGLLVVTGLDIKIQTYMVEHNIFNATVFESNLLIPSKAPNIAFNVAKPYTAPEFKGIAGWLNSDGEKLSDLKGKVVLIDFWTYSCINCLRTVPILNGWYQKYKDDGLVIIGVHSPEFQFEKVKQNVQNAIDQYSIKYPVAQDNDFATWNAYQNEYWPAEYIIDKTGKVRQTHFGEGEYDQTETVIRSLLQEGTDMSFTGEVVSAEVPIKPGQTPETYLGYKRTYNFVNYQQSQPDKSSNYTLKDVSTSQWSLGGNWTVAEDDIVSDGDDSILKLNFSAKDVYLVMGSDSAKSVSVMLNGSSVSLVDSGADVNSDHIINVNQYRLYKIISLPEFKTNQTLELRFDKGINVNAFTFGS